MNQTCFFRFTIIVVASILNLVFLSLGVVNSVFPIASIMVKNPLHDGDGVTLSCLPLLGWDLGGETGYLFKNRENYSSS